MILGYTSYLILKQDCISVGCVPPTHWPYLPACSAPVGGYLVLGGTWSQGGCLLLGGGVSALGSMYLVRGLYLVWGVCSRGYLVLGGVPGPRGVSAPRGCTWSWGVSPPRGVVPGLGGCLLLGEGCTWSQGAPAQVLHPSPWTEFLTHAYENITLP